MLEILCKDNLATQQSWIQATCREIASGNFSVVEPFLWL